MIARKSGQQFFAVSLGTIAVIGALAEACSSSSGAAATSCADDPTTCAAGTTCWPKDCTCPSGVTCSASNCTAHLECLPSLAGKTPHDSCIDTVGTPTCSDHEACVVIQPGFGGCLRYCDDAQANRGCPAIETCVDLRVGQADDSPVIHVCAIVEPDGGADGGGASPNDSGAIYDVRTDLPM